MFVLLSAQVIIAARDRGMPTVKQAVNRARVQVNVVRNTNDPIFFNRTYTATIRQDVPTGHQVATVAARDADTAVSIGL